VARQKADPAALVRDAEIRCPRCGAGRCARPHAWRRRKKVTDLSTGAVFENIPILRVRFCDGTTGSLVPAELWRGRFTISSVLETTVHLWREGVEATAQWASYAAGGEPIVSDSTLRRWGRLVRTRVIGSAFSWLAAETTLHWSDTQPQGAQLEALLETISPPLLAGFRLLFRRGLLDRPSVARARDAARTPARPVAGRRDPTPSHDLPPSPRPRGAGSVRRSRGPPPGHRSEVTAA
jgi:hypothetical protein